MTVPDPSTLRYIYKLLLSHAVWQATVRIFYNLFTHSTDRYLDCFQFGGFMHKAVLDTVTYVYICMFSCEVMSDYCDPIDCSLLGSSVHEILPGKNTGVGCHFLLQGIFPTQELNPALLQGRQIPN